MSGDSRLPRLPDRFLSVDSALFLDRDITSWDYVHRYGASLLHDSHELQAALGCSSTADVEDVMDFDGEVYVRDEGLEFQLGVWGTLLAFPFTLIEMQTPIDDLEAGVG